jgi:hypothetical protein
MGQSASKGLSKVAERVAKQATPELKRPPIPKRTPIENPLSSTANGGAAGNPGNFLRGEGIASKDPRDMGQEMYLQYAQQQQVQKGNANNGTATATGGSNTGNKEMPAELLKFIQDVGPTKQTIDREFTTPRLLQEENQEELNKAESSRSTRRKRVRMPLMGDDHEFTTEKNTNYATASTSALSSSNDDDFGLTNVELYDLLRQKDNKGEENDNSKVVLNFYEKFVLDKEKGQQNSVSSSSSSSSSSKIKCKDKEKQIKMLSDVMRALDIPTLRMDMDNNILGLYPHEVPGPEMQTFSTIPENKAMLVLKDLMDNGITHDAGRAADKLIESRRQRKMELTNGGSA